MDIIERLRADGQREYSVIEEAVDEISRLRACEDALLAKTSELYPDLRAEIAKLRAALEEVSSCVQLLGLDGWSDAQHVMKVITKALGHEQAEQPTQELRDLMALNKKFDNEQ